MGKGNPIQKHEVEVLVYVEQAVKQSKPPQLKESVRDTQRKVIYENPVANHHFHLEYQLLPGADQVPFKTDVTVYGGVIAKVFTDVDSKVVKTWEEDGLSWYGWKHKHKFKLLLDDLLKLYEHSILFRVWNTKSRFSVKARYDRPKAFRLPGGDGVLASLSHATSSGSVVEYHPSRPKKMSCVYHSISFQKKDVEKRQRRGQTSSDSEIERDVKSPEGGSIPQALDEGREEEGEDVGAGPVDFEQLGQYLGSSKKSTKAELQELAERKRVAKEGILQLDLNWSDVFGKNALTKTSSIGSNRNLEEMRVSLHVSTALMPDEWRRKLSPVTFTIEEVHNIPHTPVSHQELQERCKPAYVRFQLLDLPPFQTGGTPQEEIVVCNEGRVLLLGTVDSGILLEYLRGPPMMIELHDRDRLPGQQGPRPSLFGTEQQDGVIGTTAFVAGSSLRHNPFCEKEEPFDPFGVASLDLSELLSGQTYYEFSLQVKRGPRRPSPDALTTSCELSLPPGDYVRSGTVLKMKVELTYPFTLEENNLVTGYRGIETETDSSCPFVRGVFLLSSGKKGARVLKNLLHKVTQVNLQALHLDEVPEDVQHTALSTYKLTRDEMSDHCLDIITGCHVSDGELHIVILEGLRRRGMQYVWEGLPHDTSQDEGVVHVLWNSSFQFSKRLYGGLDVDISCIRLHKPLRSLVRQSRVYVQDSVPETNFEGLMRLNELTHVLRLSNAVKYDLFPTTEMVVGLSAEFGVPATFEDLALHQAPGWDGDGKEEEEGREEDGSPTRSVSFKRTRRRCKSLDNHNPWYNALLDQRKKEPEKNFIQSNITATTGSMERSVTRRPHSVAGGRRYLEPVGPAPPPLQTCPSPSRGGPVFNYSTQKLNSTEQSREVLRQRLAQDPHHRYTYSQEYHSMTVVPVNEEEASKLKEEERRKKWLTSEGFRYPLVPSSLSSNAHPKHPHESRVEDLQEPFEDNLLHWNRTRPTVERLQFPWDEKEKDFELHRKPPLDFGVSYPPTIHLAGDSRKKELGDFLDKEEEKWTQSLVVSDTRFHGLRRGAKTEQTSRGRHASNQMDKLQGLLKSSPERHSLKDHSDLPALSTLHSFGLSGQQDSNIAGDRGKGYRPGGLRGSLKVDRNVIPISTTP